MRIFPPKIKLIIFKKMATTIEIVNILLAATAESAGVVALPRTRGKHSTQTPITITNRKRFENVAIKRMGGIWNVSVLPSTW